MKLRIEYRYDPESRNWSFVVPSLGIVGGADTRQEAAKQALEAIEFTLESENDAELPGEGEVACVLVVCHDSFVWSPPRLRTWLADKQPSKRRLTHH